MRWDVDLRFANGVKMKFKPGGDYTQFTGTKGWVGISRGGIKAEPASLLTVKIKDDEKHLIDSGNHGGQFHPVRAVRGRRR